MKKITALILSLVLILGISPVTAEAASNVQKLKSGKTYKTYDFTGDGKADRFKYVITRQGGGGQARIYLNGKKIQTIDLLRGGELYRCAASKKNVFLVATKGQFGANTCQAFAYKNGKFKNAYNSFYKYSLDYVTPYKITSKTFTVKTTSGKHNRTFNSYDHPISFLVKYKVQKNKLALASRYASVTGTSTFTAAKDFTTSTSVSKDNVNGPYVKAGTKVKVKKAYFGKNYVQKYLISVNGRTGWVSSESQGLFQ